MRLFQAVDQTHFYLPLDVMLIIDMFKSEIQYLGQNWRALGRPTIVFPIKSTHLGWCLNRPVSWYGNLRGGFPFSFFIFSFEPPVLSKVLTLLLIAGPEVEI